MPDSKEGMDKQTLVNVPDLSETLCGKSRPGHFAGMATVVSKLFNIVQPDIAIFGKKDFQQLAIIEKMVADLCIPIQIIGEETARANDGLALSSRNGFLNCQQRLIAPVIHQTLQECREAVAEGFDSFSELEKHGAAQLRQAGFEIDYFTIRDSKTLHEVTADTETIVILVAATLGKPRLIDNVTLTLNPSSDWLMLATN